MKTLTCPVRGELNVPERAQDGIIFSEEFQRIECVKFLIQKGYLKERFDFEENVLRYGNRGVNTLRADIVIYKQDKKSIQKEDRVENIEIVAEIKRSSDKDAIRYQLLPALNHCPNAKYGIYWDDKKRIFLRKEEQDKEYEIIRLPRLGEGWDEKLLRLIDLHPIDDHTKLLNIINQRLHNTGGGGKSYRYGEIFKLLLIKYYDEFQNENSEDVSLEFQLYEDETDAQLKIRIENLYTEARGYYTTNSTLKIDENISLHITNLKQFISILQQYSFLKTEQSVIQDFFIKFAPEFLRAELDQYYTPKEVVEFIADILKLKQSSLVIDPCGGSADFLTSFIKKGVEKKIRNIRNNVHYWDISEEASNVATLNMILNGDGRTNVQVLDSIKEVDRDNERFDIIATNPPFGVQTIWAGDIDVMKNYTLGKDGEGTLLNQQLGVLFIERDYKLLKEGGILAIVLPNGYLTKKSYTFLRKFIFEKFRVIADIELPGDLFKKSNASGYTSLLILQKEVVNTDYEIFLAEVKNIGFEHKRKTLPKLYKKDENGNNLLDEENRPMPDNDLLEIKKAFKYFAFNNSLDNFEQSQDRKKYNKTNRRSIEKDLTKVISSTRFDEDYLEEIKKIKNGGFTTLTQLDAEISQEKDFELVDSNTYEYIEIGDTFSGIYRSKSLKGWQLPGRAKMLAKKNDIFVASLSGCIGKFFMYVNERENVIVSNGFYRVRIDDEKDRLNFYKFLNSNSFRKQMYALKTGTILSTIEEEDFKENLYIPTDKREENAKAVKSFIKGLALIKEDE